MEFRNHEVAIKVLDECLNKYRARVQALTYKLRDKSNPAYEHDKKLKAEYECRIVRIIESRNFLKADIHYASLIPMNEAVSIQPQL